VSAVGEYIPQRVLSEPVAIPWVAIRKTVNATAYRHDVKDTLNDVRRQTGTRSA
jgi:hypothetical protein